MEYFVISVCHQTHIVRPYIFYIMYLCTNGKMDFKTKIANDSDAVTTQSGKLQ